MPTLTILPSGKTIDAEPGSRLLDAILAAGEKIVSKCGGEAKCGECHVFVQEGRKSVSKMQRAENEKLDTIVGVGSKSRLACQTLFGNDNVTVELLGTSVASLARPDVDGVLGPATDGGWWALGLSDPRDAGFLLGVPMSRPDTGAHTLAGLEDTVGVVVQLPELTDVDTVADLWPVASLQPVDRRFRRAVERIGLPR